MTKKQGKVYRRQEFQSGDERIIQYRNVSDSKDIVFTWLWKARRQTPQGVQIVSGETEVFGAETVEEAFEKIPETREKLHREMNRPRIIPANGRM